MSILVRDGYVDLQAALIYSVARISSAASRGIVGDKTYYIYEVTETSYEAGVSVPIVIKGVEWGVDDYAGSIQTQINMIVEKASDEDIIYPQIFENITGKAKDFLRKTYRHPLHHYPNTKHVINISPESVITFIRTCLADGEIESWFVGKSGEYRLINASYWASFSAGWAVDQEHGRADRIFSDDEEIGTILVKKKDIEGIIDAWETSYNDNIKKCDDKEIEILPKARVGAPEKYDKVLFLAGAFNHIYINGSVPGDVSKLAKAAIEYYVGAGGINAPPSDKWAWNITSELWKKMGLRAGEKAPEGD